nr:unnamed protein product [Spirometra erinaceieuropaei]
MFVVENDRICRESAVSVGEGGRVSAKAMRRPVPAAVIQRRTRQSLVSTMPAQCFIRPSIQRSPQYTVHAAQAHSVLTWFSPPVETVARGVAAEQSPATWSHRGTPTYGLAKWLFRLLKFLTAESDTTVSSSAQFLEKLKGVSIHPNEVMVSFDVTSLFTSIPQDLAIETNELLLQSKYDETEKRLGHAQVLQLLKLCLRTYFTFDGTIYEQVKGTPMGSPISGFIAEAVLQRLESLVFQHCRPKFWTRQTPLKVASPTPHADGETPSDEAWHGKDFCCHRYLSYIYAPHEFLKKKLTGSEAEHRDH